MESEKLIIVMLSAAAGEAEPLGDGRLSNNSV